MKANLFIPVLALGMFLLGFSLSQVFAQNGTSSDSQVFAQISTNSIMAIVGLITAISAVIKTLVDKGIISKKLGTVAVIASDTSRAVADSRQDINDGLQAAFETIQITSPEAADAIKKAQPIIQRVGQRADEYTPKVNTFGRIASKLSEQGDKTTDDIKNNESLKKQIPNDIVPT